MTLFIVKYINIEKSLHELMERYDQIWYEIFQGLSGKWYSGKRSVVEMVFRGNAFGEMAFGEKVFGDVAVRPWEAIEPNKILY